MKIKLTKGYRLGSRLIFQFEQIRNSLNFNQIRFSTVLKLTNEFKCCRLNHLFLKLFMRTFVFLFCATLFSLTPKNVLSQNDKIVVKADTMISIDEVFKMIKYQTNYMFVYHHGLFKNFPKVRLKKGSIRVGKLLKQSLPISQVNIIVAKNNTILIKEKIRNFKAQQRTVSGIVSDQLGLPIFGATVLIKGTYKGVVTDLDGQYTIMVPDPANVLVFSSLSFVAQEITIGNQTTINVSFKEDVSQLGTVTINAGYYSTSERERTGSISKIEAKDIEKQPVNNPLAAMQGYIPGVDIIQDSGLPGGGYQIQIRGQNFINSSNGLTNNSEPLFVIDGIPFDSSSFGSSSGSNQIIPGGRVSPLNTINPADIKSIEVLKDADATAIYGSRGANGVVLITTKKGKIGKTQINLDVAISLSKVTVFEELLNSEQHLELSREMLSNSGFFPLPDWLSNSTPSLSAWDTSRYTDWQEVLIGGTAYRQNTQLSISGGSERTQFLLSAGYVSETTVFPGDSKYEKASIHTNINHQSEDQRFKLNFSASYSSDTNNLPGINFMKNARTLLPYAPALYDDEGNLNWENSTWENPLAILESEYQSNAKSLVANSVLSYSPISTLEFKASLGYTDYRLASHWARPNSIFDPNEIGGQDSNNSIITTRDGVRETWIIEPQINWQQHWDDFDIKILFGATFQQSKQESQNLSGVGFVSNDLIFNVGSANIQTINVAESIFKYQSFFGRINFNWKNKYILNFTGRRDGSSKFGPGNQFGYFGAIGAAWLFSEENIIKESEVISLGKLRASYGITGADTIPLYAFYDSYQEGSNYNGSSLIPTGLSNPNIQWEVNKKYEIGLDLGFFKDRIFFSTAWYLNRSSNQLLSVPLPTTTGFFGISDNLNGAIVQNKGFEIDLRLVNIGNDHFNWSTTFNISVNRNKLVSFPGLEGSTFTNLIVGEPLGIRSRYHALGVDPESGLYQFEDYNNDGNLNRDDRQWLVDLTPKYFGGFGNTLTYKNLKLDIFFQFKKQKGRTSDATFGMPNLHSNLPVSILNRWQQSGDQAPIQRLAFRDSDALNAWDRYFDSTASVADTSFIRLRNVLLSYSLTKEITGGVGVNIYLQGQNLLLITKQKGTDPEVPGLNLPPLKLITMGLNLKF